MTLRCLTRLGMSMVRPLPGRGGCRDLVARDGPLLRDVAPIDPDLDADPAVGRVGVDLAVADVGAQRAQRDAAFAIPLAATHLGAPKATGDRDPDALGAGLHRALDGLLHCLL